jgi:PAS domain S-box-containing protein
MDWAETVSSTLMAASADAIVAADRDNRIVHWGRGAERIFGHRAADVLGGTLDIIIPERLRAVHGAAFSLAMARGESRYGDADLLSAPGVTKDGRTVALEFTVAMIRNDKGEVAGVVATIRDATKRFDEMRKLKKRVAELEAPKG